jgi:hypothetical protein
MSQNRFSKRVSDYEVDDIFTLISMFPTLSIDVKIAMGKNSEHVFSGPHQTIPGMLRYVFRFIFSIFIGSKGAKFYLFCWLLEGCHPH